MKKFLVSKNIKERKSFIKKHTTEYKIIAIYNKVPIDEIKGLFNETYKLVDLYKDEIFLTTLSKIDKNTIVFFIDLGLDYCSFKNDYIRPYLKLQPIKDQANDTFIIDGFAFYNTEKSIYRPFLYIDDKILDSSVQEFYNVGEIYKEYEGNKIENYYKKIKPYILFKTQPIEIEVVRYSPSDGERKEYDKLKKDIIIYKKYPKSKVIKILLDYVNNTKTKLKSIKNEIDDGVLNVVENSDLTRLNMYKRLLTEDIKKIIFYSSGFYGVDEIELSRTKEALERHNELIRLINGE